MSTLYSQVNYPLKQLVYNIEQGVIGLPDIQRPFVWDKAKVRDLFDSMYKGFPVGYLLFWKSDSDVNAKLIGDNTKQKIPELLIVDGQQRLTSLFSVISGFAVYDKDFNKQNIRIAFKPSEEKFEVATAATDKSHEYIKDISHLWNQNGGIFSFISNFLNGLESNNGGELTPEDKDRISTSINKVYNLENYSFTALEIASHVNEEDVSDIFVRINSKGETLNQANFILTLMSVYWEVGRRQLEQFCREARRPPADRKPSSFNYHIKPDPDHLLRVSIGFGFKRARLKYGYLILRGKDLETEKFSDEKRNEQFEKLKLAQEKVLNITNWHEFLKTLMRAGFRSDKMISSKMNIVYSYTMFLIGKYEYGLSIQELRSIIGQWFFMSNITRRYTGSPESVMEQDIQRLPETKTPDAFKGHMTQILKDTLTEDYWKITLVNELDSSSATSPALHAFHASLCSLDAKALFSDLKVVELLDPTIQTNRSAIERHHLFPKGFLKTKGISDLKKTNQIANYALLEWSDNLNISDDPPFEYFPKYKKRFENDITEMMHFHALPEGWEKMDYNDFITERRKLIAQIIREGFEKLSAGSDAVDNYEPEVDEDTKDYFSRIAFEAYNMEIEEDEKD